MTDRLIGWDEIGYVNRESGLIERPVAAETWSAPKVVVKFEDSLQWNEWHDSHEVHSGPKMLERFTRLYKARDSSIIDYARTWGVLNLCSQSNPASRQICGACSHAHQATIWCDPQRYRAGYVRESLMTWRIYSRVARLIMNVALHLHQHKSPLFAQVEYLGEWASGNLIVSSHLWDIDPDAPPHMEPDVEDFIVSAGRLNLNRAINRWLELGGVRPFYSWESTSPTVTFGYAGLFGALGVQLMLVASSSRGFATCSVCGRSYIPTRSPVEGKRRYCDECRAAKWPQRDATKDSRERKTRTRLQVDSHLDSQQNNTPEKTADEMDHFRLHRKESNEGDQA